jgi:hypothetical protein
LGLPNVPWNLSNPSVVKTGLHITVTLVTWRGVLGWDKSYCAKNTDYLEKFSESSGFVVLWSYFQYILHTCGYLTDIYFPDDLSTDFTLCLVLLQPTVRIKLAMILNLLMVYILLAFIYHEL